MFDLLFTSMCTGPAGITVKRRRLIPESLPTEYMPVRTAETPQSTRKETTCEHLFVIF